MYIIVYYSLLVYYRALVITTSPPRPWNPAPRSTCPPLTFKFNQGSGYHYQGSVFFGKG